MTILQFYIQSAVTVFMDLIIPGGIMLACYIHMAIVLGKSLQTFGSAKPSADHPNNKPMNSRDAKLHKAQQNILHVGMILVAAFIVCWSYVTIINIFMVTGKSTYGSNEWNGAVMMLLVNSCINPFIYTMRYQEFQRSAKTLFCGAPPNPSNAFISRSS